MKLWLKKRKIQENPKHQCSHWYRLVKKKLRKFQSIKSVSSQQTSEEKIPEVQPEASTTEPAKVVAPVQEEEIIQEMRI